MIWIAAGAGAHLIVMGEGHLHGEAGGMIHTNASGCCWVWIEPSSYLHSFDGMLECLGVPGTMCCSTAQLSFVCVFNVQ
jgi:hypothetical protein